MTPEAIAAMSKDDYIAEFWPEAPKYIVALLVEVSIITDSNNQLAVLLGKQMKVIGMLEQEIAQLKTSAAKGGRVFDDQ